MSLRLLRTLLAQSTLVQQAKVNTKRQFLESPHLSEGFLDAVADNQGANSKMPDMFFTARAGVRRNGHHPEPDG